MNNWISEEEMYKIILDNGLLEEAVEAEKDSRLLILSQKRINKRGDMPDFIILQHCSDGKKIIHIVEVKITASLDLISQQKKYDNAIFQLIAENPDLHDGEIRTSIIYRFIDSKLNPFLEDGYNGWLFLRLEQIGDTWGFSCEDEFSPELRNDFTETVVNFFGGSHG